MEAAIAWRTRQSGATPDSPVNYSGVAPRIPEGGKFGVGFPGAPDTIWCHTGQSGAPPDTVRRQPRHPTVRVRPLELLSSGSPDSPVVHRTGPVDCLVRLLHML